MRILTVTSLFPNAVKPRHGIFVRERLRQLQRRHPVDATVIAPVPWFPSRSARWGRFAEFARVPDRETCDAVAVHHPRFLTVPAFGNITNPLAMSSAVETCLKQQGISDFDVVDAHYGFPDGAAAVLLARKLDKPVVLTVRGSDVNILANEPVAGWWLRRTLAQCDAIIAVSEALAERTRQLVPSMASRIHAMPNGVDTERFAIREPTQFSDRPEEKLVLCAANLVALKGVHLVIEAMASLPNAVLWIAGSGPEEPALRRQVVDAGVQDRVRFLGTIDQEALIDAYNLADVTVLASASEGMPNVVLESLACGTPVVSTDVGDIRSILNSSMLGRVAESRTAAELARGLREVLAEERCRERVRAQASAFSWQTTCAGVYQILREVQCSRSRRQSRLGGVPR